MSSGKLKVAKSFISLVLKKLPESESSFGIIIQEKDLLYLVFDGHSLTTKNIREDVTIPTRFCTSLKKMKNPSEKKVLGLLLDCVWDILIDGHELQGLCCRDEKIILPKAKTLDGLVELERLKDNLIETERVGDQTKLDLAMKECSCS